MAPALIASDPSGLTPRSLRVIEAPASGYAWWGTKRVWIPGPVVSSASRGSPSNYVSVLLEMRWPPMAARSRSFSRRYAAGGPVKVTHP